MHPKRPKDALDSLNFFGEDSPMDLLQHGVCDNTMAWALGSSSVQLAFNQFPIVIYELYELYRGRFEQCKSAVIFRDFPSIVEFFTWYYNDPSKNIAIDGEKCPMLMDFSLDDQYVQQKSIWLQIL